MNNYTAYQKCAIETASREDILLNLYEGAVIRLKTAKQSGHCESGKKPWELINQAVAIITELDNTLDREKGDPNLVSELDALYKFMIRELHITILQKDLNRLQPVLDILETLYSGWQDAVMEIKGLSKNQSSMTANREYESVS